MNKVAMFDDVIGSSCELTLTEDSFNFLKQTGRELYWKQGYKGQNVIIAVIDTGVNANHPELIGQCLLGKNFCPMDIGDQNNTNDLHGHGTHVAATICGKLKCGVAPAAKILPVRVLDGGGMLWYTDWLFNAMRYVRDWRSPEGKHVDVVSMSLGGHGWSPSEIATLEGIIQQLNSMGILVIAASGNTGTEDIRYPAALDSVIAVGAVDIQRQLAYFSTTGSQVDLCQIGVDVVSADYKTTGYKVMSGTSMSTPLVTGIAALMISKDKALNGRYNTGMAGSALELCYYQMLRNLAIDVFETGEDKKSGAGFCTLNQRLLTELRLAQGSNQLYADNKLITMDTPVSVINDRTMVPLRAPFESAGGIVTYNGPYDIRVLI